MESPTAAPFATGIGSMPGTEIAESLRMVRDLIPDLPHLPELPQRGPGADLIGRTASRLLGFSVDLQPHGWRLTPHNGRDQARALAFWREDLDQLATIFDGWTGPLKFQLAGPWSLSASLWLPRGERSVVDPGARRDLIQSLAETAAQLCANLTRLIPGATPLLQLDEPSLPAVLAGRLPTASGYGLLRAIPGAEVRDGLREVLDAIQATGASAAVHCCAADVPTRLLREAGAKTISLDTSLLGRRDWQALAEAVDAGTQLWAGTVPAQGNPGSGSQAADRLWRSWNEVGLPPQLLNQVTVTPSCGLADASPEDVVAALQAATEASRELRQRG